MQEKSCALTIAASIPAWQQSEDTGTRLLGCFFFDAAPHLELFSNFQEMRKVPDMEDWDAALSPCNFATTHFRQKETFKVVLSPCNFATTRLTGVIL